MTRHQLTCEEVIEQLFVFLDGELDADRLAAIERHLESCRDCCSRAEFERKLRAKVAEAATAQAPERLRTRVQRMLERF